MLDYSAACESYSCLLALFISLKDLNEVYGSKDPTGKLVEQRMVIYNTPQESSFPDIHERAFHPVVVLQTVTSMIAHVGLGFRFQ
jgi:hypothetical protein